MAFKPGVPRFDHDNSVTQVLSLIHKFHSNKGGFMRSGDAVIRIGYALITLASSGLLKGQEKPGAANPATHVSGALEVTYASETCVPALDMILHLGPYHPEMCFPVAIVTKDPYNDNKASVSWSAAASLGAIMLAGVMHPEDVPGVRNFLFYTTIVPLLALNCQHYLTIAGPDGVFESDVISLAIFAGWRTDAYSPGITWMRWTPMAGIQQAIRLPGDDVTTTGKWVAVMGGIERPVGTQSPPPRLFVSLKYLFPT